MRKHLRAAVVGFLIAGFSSGGFAWAFWTITGQGSVAAKAGTLQAVVFAPATSTGKGLVPGGTATVFAMLTNPNDASVQLTALAYGSVVDVTPGNASCDSAVGPQLTFSAGAFTPVTVPAGATISASWPGLVTAAEALDACAQGAALTFVVSGTTVA